MKIHPSSAELRSSSRSKLIVLAPSLSVARQSVNYYSDIKRLVSCRVPPPYLIWLLNPPWPFLHLPFFFGYSNRKKQTTKIFKSNIIESAKCFSTTDWLGAPFPPLPLPLCFVSSCRHNQHHGVPKHAETGDQNVGAYFPKNSRTLSDTQRQCGRTDLSIYRKEWQNIWYSC